MTVATDASMIRPIAKYRLVDRFIFLAERQRSPSRHLWRVMVERLVGFHFHRLFLASFSQIVYAGFVTFV